MDGLVSVIVAIYNVEKYLDKCIESIINQSYSNLEIILLNDGSIDKSGKICDYYSKVDKRVKVIHKENSGVSNTRNKGLDIAKGQYITFVDGDDYIELNMIEKMYNNIISSNSDISICGYNIFYDDSNKIKKSDEESDKNILMTNEDVLSEIFKSNKINGFLWNKFFRKDLFNEIRLPENMDLCEDLYVVCEILQNNIKSSYISACLYNYRYTSSGLTKNISQLFMKDGKVKYIDVYEKLYELYSNNKYILSLMKDRSIKIIMETYYLTIKNRYYNINSSRYMYNFLIKNKKYYLTNKNIPLKLKLAFVVFTFKLKLDNLKLSKLKI